MAKSGPKPSSSSKKKKKTKHFLTAPAAAAMKSSHSDRPNPFESIWSRRKFDTLGRRPKGEERRVGAARSQAIEKRKKTLQKEYEESAKSSTFLDKRIGERDDTLQEFDKAVLRLQRERQLKLKRSSKYNLSDGEEDDFDTHEPRSLSARDDFEDEFIPDDDDAIIGTKNASSSKFLSLHGGHDLPENNSLDAEENNHKTKKQVMQEIISKSKHYKAQKAMDKEEDTSLMEKLDKDFASLAQSEALRDLTQPSKMNALKALLNKTSTRQSTKDGDSTKAPSGSADEESLKEKPDAYDKLVKEMVLDMRARPSDRTKSPEEIAQEEKERLEELEEKRRKRMLSNADSSDEDSDSDGDTKKPDTKKFKSISGDDLGDSFSIDRNEKGWVDDIYKKDSDNSDEDDSSSKGSESEEEGDDDENDNEDDENETIANDKISVQDWEQSDDEDLSTDVEEMNAPAKRGITLNGKASLNVHKRDTPDSHESNVEKPPASKQEALPFVIEAPKDLSELCLLLDNRADSQVVEAIKRIRACNTVKLAAENRKKMQVFYGVLLQYFASLTTRRPLNITLINSFVKPLVEMSSETPYFAAICARQRLIHIRTRFTEDIKAQEKSSWPSLKTLLLLRLWSLIFPCSDFRHVVMTPALLLMCEYLMRCPILSGRDMAIGTFLCSMVLSVAKQSRKLFPEAVTFLHTLLLSAAEQEAGLQNSQCSPLLELKTLKPWLHIRNQLEDVPPVDFYMVMEAPAESPFFDSDNFKASILLCVVETLNGFISLYEGLSSFPEMFQPFTSLLHEILQKANLPGILQGKIKDCIDLIKRKVDETLMFRQPLQMRKQKPVPLRLLNPKFEENFVKGRDYDPDRERSERKKLKKRLKNEAKGAIRELRKDNHFIFQLKEKDKMQQEEERADKYKKAMSFLQEQEHAYKSGQLGKGKGKKRRK